MTTPPPVDDDPLELDGSPPPALPPAPLGLQPAPPVAGDLRIRIKCPSCSQSFDARTITPEEREAARTSETMILREGTASGSQAMRAVVAGICAFFAFGANLMAGGYSGWVMLLVLPLLVLGAAQGIRSLMAVESQGRYAVFLAGIGLGLAMLALARVVNP